jgi:hypothetical protein
MVRVYVEDWHSSRLLRWWGDVFGLMHISSEQLAFFFYIMKGVGFVICYVLTTPLYLTRVVTKKKGSFFALFIKKKILS